MTHSCTNLLSSTASLPIGFSCVSTPSPTASNILLKLYDHQSASATVPIVSMSHIRHSMSFTYEMLIFQVILRLNSDSTCMSKSIDRWWSSDLCVCFPFHPTSIKSNRSGNVSSPPLHQLSTTTISNAIPPCHHQRHRHILSSGRYFFNFYFSWFTK